MARDDDPKLPAGSNPIEPPSKPMFRPLPQRLDRLVHSTVNHTQPNTPSPNPLAPSSTSTTEGTSLTGSRPPVTPSHFVLPAQPKTPRTKRVVDRVGEEFKGNLPYILSELKRTLESLLPAKDPSKRFQSSLAPPLADQATSLTFKCERAGFLNTMNMVEYCQRLANKTPPPPPASVGLSTLAESLAKSMEKNMLAMEDNMNAALTEHAKTVSSSLEQLKSELGQNNQSKTYAQTVNDQTESPDSQNQKPKRKDGVTQAPALFPSITLSQKFQDKPVEFDSDDKYLVERINQHLQFYVDLHSSDENPLSIHNIRGFSRNRRTGDINIQFNSQEDADVAASTHASWIPALNNSLRLKQPSYPIIVHGIPTSFDPTNAEDVENLVAINEGILDSLESIKWANRQSIEAGKPFSSLIIHLRDPDEANKAIKNKINFFSVLKMAEKSVRKLGQCFKCLQYGHSAMRCNAVQRCSSCGDNHPNVESCPNSQSPSCINCLLEIIKSSQRTNPSFAKKDMTDARKAYMAHPATASACPTRRKLAADTNTLEFFTVNKKNRTSHVVR